MSDPKGVVAGVKHRTPRRGQESTILRGAPTEQKGRQFDSSIGRTPFTFTLGAGQVIAGFDRGRVGDEGRRAAARDRTARPLVRGPSAPKVAVFPPNATLVFDIEQLEVQG